ncbi:Glyco transf 22 domain containing protein [Asbolus verrucosus]|uniref:Integrator complex subunit 10 n=1 Tax=Asbolus verrucosus TaxID=1661398 RepID=A0A482V0B0_ASBVE|nr:Glyco transf 22 domain containing protein [Asbolus verrucosus]
MEVDLSDEDYVIQRAKTALRTDPLSAKAWMITAKTLYPNNFGVQFEAYCIEKNAGHVKEAAKCFSDLIGKFQQQPELWKEIENVTSALRAESDTNDPEKQFLCEMFKHISSDVQHKLLLCTADHCEDTMEHCRLLLLLLQRFPTAISSYGLESWFTNFVIDYAIYKGKYEDALVYLQKINDSNLLLSKYINIAGILYLKKNYRSCFEHILLAIPLLPSSNVGALSNNLIVGGSQRHLHYLPLTYTAVLQYFVKILLRCIKENMAKHNYSELAIGHILTLVQLDWPLEEEFVPPLMEQIQQHGSFNYVLFQNYIINVDILEEITYLWTNQGGQITLDIIPHMGQRRIGTRGADKGAKEEIKQIIKRQVARSNENLASVFLVRTFFVPDEYWQSLEVSHRFAFGYGYLTWEWKAGIRSYIYPLIFSGFYTILKLVGLDDPTLLIYGPRILQAVLSAYADLCFYHWSGTRKWAVFSIATSWFWFYTGSRTLINSFENALSTIALSQFPWLGKGKGHGSLIITPYEFLKFNIFEDVASWYGSQPWFWYLSAGFPAILGIHFIPFILATLVILKNKEVHPNELALLGTIVFTLTIYSLLPHKEFRFLLSLLPLVLYISSRFLSAWSRKANKLMLWTVAVILFVGNASPAYYLGFVHQRGTVDVMEPLREIAFKYPANTSLLFLMPCHSTPYYRYTDQLKPQFEMTISFLATYM